MDVVWLKRDLRFHDHGPFAEISQSSNPFCIVYLFEPDQLSEPTVHGSHICFINEGLVDLDRTLSSFLNNKCCSSSSTDGSRASADNQNNQGGSLVNNNNEREENTVTAFISSSRCCNDSNSKSEEMCPDDVHKYIFQLITVCHANAVFTLNSINRQQKINRILCHEETGHFKSFIRDKTVRKWCKVNNVPIIEYNQTGVTRCLKNRDDFAKKLNEYLMKPLYNEDKIASDDGIAKNNYMPTQNEPIIGINFVNNGIYHGWMDRIVTTLKLHGRITHPIKLSDMNEIPLEHREDRIDRQRGGETKALKILQSFLSTRGSYYSSGISSPNTSWNSGSRLSPYLTWGNISLRFVIRKTKEKQSQLRMVQNNPSSNNNNGYWLKSLQAFSSRLHWRSHFIQKLESEPEMEKRDLCSAYQHLRRQENDWNQSYYEAWSTGTTGFPFVDASMRCLLKHGWINFRMRAMLVSFATYNLWLDWKRIAPHLARVFLDYEPGIHYPQLQMQSGTSGINAMRVYNVTKQGKDQDPDGVFIRKYVRELKDVPIEYLHEPSKMPRSLQAKIQVYIGDKASTGSSSGNHNGSITSFISNQKDDTSLVQQQQQQPSPSFYPEPIVNEQESAKIAKDKVATVRKQESTKELAEQVFIKHGSRSKEREKIEPKVSFGSTKMTEPEQGVALSPSRPLKKAKVMTNGQQQRSIKALFGAINDRNKKESESTCTRTHGSGNSSDLRAIESGDYQKAGECSWNCKACTYLNDNPLGLACAMCGTMRGEK